jgi:hypothetical protein
MKTLFNQYHQSIKSQIKRLIRFKSLCLGSLSFLLGLLLFGILRKEFLVLLNIFTSSFVTVNNSSFVLSLTAETGLSNEALDLG